MGTLAAEGFMPEDATSRPFAREMAEYDRQKSALLSHAMGQFVVVREETLIGPYSTYAEAYNEGVRNFGPVPMLIKQVLPQEPVSFAPTVGTLANDGLFRCQYSI